MGPPSDPQHITHRPSVCSLLSPPRREAPGEGFSANFWYDFSKFRLSPASSEQYMEENCRLEAPSASPDLAAAEGCRCELTRCNSGSSSVIVYDSKDYIHRKTNARPGQCLAWTDDKHNSYLDALEASFVKQLHHSMGLLYWRSGQNTCDPSPSRQLPVNASYSSDQVRQKINFERNQSLPYGAAGSHVVTESPWIHRFRCSGEHSTVTSTDLQECSMIRSVVMPLRGKKIFSHRLTSLARQRVCHQCHQDAVGIIEVSDQNFVDEDREEKSISLSRAKRLKLAAADASTKDQIVPSGNPFAGEISTASNTLSESEEQMHHERLSKNIESFVCPEPDVKSFLRES